MKRNIGNRSRKLPKYLFNSGKRKMPSLSRTGSRNILKPKCMASQIRSCPIKKKSPL